MRTAGPVALYRSAVALTPGGEPVMRELLLDLKIPCAYLFPEGDPDLRGREELSAAGIAVVAVLDCAHNVMVDTVNGFARATAAVLAGPEPGDFEVVAAEADEEVPRFIVWQEGAPGG